MRGTSLSVKIWGVEIGGVKVGSVTTDRMGISARHAAPDETDRQGPGALRPDQVLLLSVIAGMAHSTLKSGARRETASPWGHQLKIWQPRSQCSDGVNAATMSMQRRCQCSGNLATAA